MEQLKQSAEFANRNQEVNYSALSGEALEALKDEALVVYSNVEQVIFAIQREQDRREQTPLTWD